MDRWAYKMKSISLKSTNAACLVRHLSLAGARCQLLVAKAASSLWINVILKQGHAVLAIQSQGPYVPVPNVVLWSFQGSRSFSLVS